jgi:hypothetical protein
MEILTRRVRLKRNKLQGMHRKTRWKGDEFMIEDCQISFEKIGITSMEDDMPKMKYPDNNYDKMKAEKDLLDYQKKGNMDKIILTGSEYDNRKIELSKVCEMCFSNSKLRFVRGLQNTGQQSFLQFDDSMLEGRGKMLDDAQYDDASTNLVKILKLKFYSLKYLKESDVTLENVFKKRKIKISSMREDVPIIRYPEKGRIKLNNYKDGKVEKITLTEGDDSNNMIELSKVCEDVIKKQGAQSVNHKEQSILQFDRTILVGRELLWNNGNVENTSTNLTDSRVKKYLMMKLKSYERGKILMKRDVNREEDWIPCWLARSKYLRRSKMRFGWQDEMGRRFVTRWKFKMKGLLYMEERRLCSNGESFNRCFSITWMRFWEDGKQEEFIFILGQ